MLTSEVKQKIDAARQVLVGKIPNPIGQVQEITNALIYKFMDDMDEKAVSMGGKRRYFSGDYEKYSWRTIMNPKIGAHERLSLYTEALSKMSENPNIPELFRNIFRNAYLPFNDPRTLTLFLNEVNFFDYKKTEELGDAYEYLLSIMGSQGDAGQFRTPRHIIDFIVKAVNPTKDDSVLDPACGTAGFLISAYKHVMNKHDGINDDTGNPNPKEKLLTADEKNKLHKNYKGFDIDDNMVKISQVNLYLHGFPDPNIIVHDTLSSEDFWNDRYDIILANPPFMSPKGGIVPHSKFRVKSNRSEVLFVDYIVSHLKPKGRAGIIVPEGIVFNSSNDSYLQLRKILVDDGLYAVISLPNGIFSPYSGVKTSILLFDNDISKQRDEMLFIKIENDGFDLGAQRKQLNKNDLPTALDILDNWKKGGKVENGIATYVEKSQIAKNDDYNLSGDRYRVTADYTNSKWPMIELGKVIVFEQKSKRKSGDGKATGTYKFFVSSQIQNKFIDEVDYTNENLVLGTGGNVSVHIAQNFSTSADTFVFHSRNSTLSNLFLYHLLLNNKEILENGFRGQGIKHLSKEYLLKIKIPLPPLEIQEEIVKEVESYQKIIDGAKQVVDNWKPRIDIDPEWEVVRLGDIADVTAGQSPEGKYYNDNGEGTPFYQGKTEFEDVYIGKPKKWTSKTTKLADLGDILISVRAPVGPVNISQDRICIGRGLAAIRAKKIEQMFLFTYLQMIEKQIVGNGGAVFDSISKKQIEQIKVPLPSLEIQKEIVERVESERAIIDLNNKLVETYEQKIKDVISKLWEE